MSLERAMIFCVKCGVEVRRLRVSRLLFCGCPNSTSKDTIGGGLPTWFEASEEVPDITIPFLVD